MGQLAMYIRKKAFMHDNAECRPEGGPPPESELQTTGPQSKLKLKVKRDAEDQTSATGGAFQGSAPGGGPSAVL